MNVCAKLKKFPSSVPETSHSQKWDGRMENPKNNENDENRISSALISKKYNCPKKKNSASIIS